MLSTILSVDFILVTLRSLLPVVFFLGYFLLLSNLTDASSSVYFFKNNNLLQSFAVNVNNNDTRFVELCLIIVSLLLNIISWYVENVVRQVAALSVITIMLLGAFALGYAVLFTFNLCTNITNNLMCVVILASCLPIFFLGVCSSWFMFFFILEFFTLVFIWFMVVASNDVYEHVIIYAWVALSAALFLNLSITLCHHNSMLASIFFFLFVALKLGVFPFGLWVLYLYTKLDTLALYTYFVFFYVQNMLLTFFFCHFYLYHFCLFAGNSLALYFFYINLVVLLLHVFVLVFVNIISSESELFVVNTWCSALVVLFLL